MEPGLDVSVVPNLYDLGPDHTGRLFLGAVSGDMVVLSWLYPRAAFWLLDRDGIKGHFGETQLKPPADDEDEEAEAETPVDKPEAIGPAGDDPGPAHLHARPARLRTSTRRIVAEIRRIAAECRERREAKAREKAANSPAIVQLGLLAAKPRRRRCRPHSRRSRRKRCSPPAGRRWYPVIDYSRCTNCLECLDFCLFGVYGVDSLERILVENQDQCKKGCPACSRVCPEQAIIFPEYKTAAIAGRRHRRGRRAEDRPEQALRRRRRRRARGRGAGARPRAGQRRPRRGRA